ncbi:sulfite reductase beta subunit [Aspergillus ellipticus CBS 707.79]|uniref:Sulfite reductase beta subunit n=1 Tax=Aspergillus ellipticus CBS 707.79 TaxID=1448320 RepID=A0A319DCN9_9EURO|nr:sulfite reductase beta subunit [Aspergillus ellipticus CBS 707.79]
MASTTTSTADPDPVIASYDVYLTDSEISRYVLQYLDRPTGSSYDDRHGQKPTSFRLKPTTGLVEVDIPINTRVNYDASKGLRYGDALKKSRSTREGGAYGMAGGFSSGGSTSMGGKVKMEAVEAAEGNRAAADAASLLRVQTLGGRIKGPEDGDPVYMLAAFRGANLHLSPVSAVVQLHPQLHHLDALDEVPVKGKGKARKEGEEERPAEAEARAIDVKIKAAEDGEAAMVAGNLELLKKMQDEKWKDYEWVDAETEESWQLYENYMMHQDVEGLPQLESAINSEDYLDQMSAPRIDPARPDMTGWAMKQNRKKQREGEQAAEGHTEGGMIG